MTAGARIFAGISAAFLVALAWAQQPAQAPAQPTTQDRVAALKQSLQASAASIRQYEWIETTAVSIKGEEKSRTQDRCYYGVDGKVQKVPVGGPPPDNSKAPRGLRGKIAENKKEDISDSMKEAIALVKAYIPPDAAKIQAAKDAGKLAVSPPDAKGTARVAIKDYLKSGDSLSFELVAATNQLSGLSISSFTDEAKHAVGLKVAFQALPDGTIYAGSVNLDVKEENLNVAMTNTGYRKSTP